jgi:hypothetical protein
MPRLSAVQVTYLPGHPEPVDVLFTTTLPLLEAADTAVLRIVASGSVDLEFDIRLERGRVAHVHLWHPALARRHELGVEVVTVDGLEVRCSLPALVDADVPWVPALRAQLIVNGALVQSSVPVTLALGSARARFPETRSTARELALA